MNFSLHNAKRGQPGLPTEIGGRAGRSLVGNNIPIKLEGISGIPEGMNNFYYFCLF